MEKIFKILSIVIMGALVGLVTGCKQKEEKYQGYVEVKLRYISCDFSGILTNLLVQSGDIVKAGDQLFSIDKYMEQKNLEIAKEKILIAKAQIDQIQSQLNLSGIDLTRLRALQEKNFVSKSSLDAAESGYKVAVAQLDQAKSIFKNSNADVALSQWIYGKKHVSAVADAIVFDTFYNEGEFVLLSRPVLALLVPEDVKIIFFIPEKALGKVKVNQKVEITCDGCENPLPAKISYISPQPQFTPPVIFSQDTSDKLMFAIEARATPEISKKLHPGQPVIIKLK
jgi:HlyD family secretion protein